MKISYIRLLHLFNFFLTSYFVIVETGMIVIPKNLNRPNDKVISNTVYPKKEIIMHLLFLSIMPIHFVFFRYKIKIIKRLKYQIKQYHIENRRLVHINNRMDIERYTKEKERNSLQKEVLISMFLLEYRNNMLSDLKTFFIKQENLRVFRKRIEKILDIETEYSSLAIIGIDNELKRIFPSFYTSLTSISNGKLTSLEFRYCCSILLRMSTKDTADIFKVKSRSISTSKYRLKKRLLLNKNEDLDLFIQKVYNKSERTEIQSKCKCFV